MTIRTAKSSAAVPRAELPPAEVHLWYLRPESCDDRRVRAWSQRVLSPEERERCRRFAFDKDWRLFVVSRVLIRSVLSHYDGAVSPAEWQFTVGPYGKPALAARAGQPPLSFNLAHTRELAVAAVARTAQIGVDVEYVDPQVRWQLVDGCLAPAEIAAIRSSPVEERAGVFFSLWTLKEAYVKARGVGLSVPLRDVVFDLAAGEVSCARLTAAPDDDPAAWRFFQPRDFWPKHRLAIAVSRGLERDGAVRLLGPIELSSRSAFEIFDHAI